MRGFHAMLGHSTERSCHSTGFYLMRRKGERLFMMFTQKLGRVEYAEMPEDIIHESESLSGSFFID